MRKKTIILALFVGLMLYHSNSSPLDSVYLWDAHHAVSPSSPPDVLIIYSSGSPSKTISEMNTEDFHAIAGPTPKTMNCQILAQELAALLLDEGLSVRTTEVTKVESDEEVLAASLVVLGSPARFWNVSWQMKKLLDEKFGQIYGTAKERFASRKIAAFAMAEIEPSALAALDALKLAVQDCGGKMGPTLIVLTKDTNPDTQKKIRDFAHQLAVLLMKN
jgi:flavodoxin